MRDPTPTEFIQFQDALIWEKYFRANYGLCLSDSLMKDQEHFSHRLQNQVEAELGPFHWEGVLTQFNRFKNEYQDVELFLKDKDLNFLFDEPRFVNYCWATFLINNSRKNNYIPYGRSFDIRLDISRNINGDEFNNNLRRDSVINCIQNTSNTSSRKRKFILELRNEWSKSKYKDISWLAIDDVDNNQWIFDALVENEISRLSLKPENVNEYYWSILMLLDTERNSRFLDNLIPKIRKSLSQRKYRAKHQELKYYSIAMSEESKEKLDSIVRKEDTKIYKVIERLINQEYDKI